MGRHDLRIGRHQRAVEPPYVLEVLEQISEDVKHRSHALAPDDGAQHGGTVQLDLRCHRVDHRRNVAPADGFAKTLGGVERVSRHATAGRAEVLALMAAMVRSPSDRESTSLNSS